MKQTFALLLCYFASASCSRSRIFRDYPCREDRPIINPADINYAKFSGIWYLQYDYYSPTAEPCDCVVYDLEFQLESNHTARGCCYKDDSCVDLTAMINFIDSSFVSYDPDRNEEYQSANYVYSLLDIDYNQFFLSHLCRNLPDGKSEERIRIATRTLVMNPELDSKISDYIHRYFDRPFLRKINLDEAKCGPLWEIFLQRA